VTAVRVDPGAVEATIGALRSVPRDETGSGLVHLAADWLEALMAERDALRRRVDEAEEKIAYLGAGCMKLTREDLIQRITAVEPTRWQAGRWLDAQLEPIRAERDALRPQAAIGAWVQAHTVPGWDEMNPAAVYRQSALAAGAPVSGEPI
jgi:hypothetical protein